jgi:hypothetical protein
MTASEFQAQLANHQVEQQMLADRLRREAGETRTAARAYAAQHSGGGKMEEYRAQILGDAETKAQGLEMQAARASQRSREAGAGRLLHSRPEWSDIGYQTNAVHQKLVAAATEFGVLVQD